MSRFTNPASRSVEGAEAYVRATLDLIEGRDLFEILEGTGERLRKVVSGLSREQLAQPEAPGKWSLGQVVMHIADNEMVDAWRIKLTLCAHEPPIHGYDQDVWASRLRYTEVPLEEALSQFVALRAVNLRLFRSLGEDELERVAMHEERGPESVRLILQLLAGHDLIHLAQMERMRAKL